MSLSGKLQPCLGLANRHFAGGSDVNFLQNGRTR
nr:MAG TPA: hypothetical protein [Caudoviricetes sp.]